ncbi:MAG: UDP-N-acetylmuramoyl-L-alanyl-D-glutamate--2,6-diaminopimelate ligase [Acidobacteria bacterium]|nr:MAG: UDP-N-acetylmuramoyl-L-alanyl-D-glutamate--2,6-diaminopimelate ligase [Acidobacteriota bacterium]
MRGDGVQLRRLLDDVPGARLSGDAALGIRGVAYDSRAVEPGFLFAALRGSRRDGNEFVAQAIAKGAVAVLSNRARGGAPAGVAWVQADDERRALALVARNYYGRPDERMTLIGVTGTNGKTTVCFLLEAALREAGLKPCLLGTVLYRYGRDEAKAERTTPESLDLFRLLDRFATAGARSCAMEVSSHSLVLERVAGIGFKAGVFTNLTQDHLDFHRTMEAYLEAKAILFRNLAPSSIAVLNADDPHTPRLREVTRARVVTFGREAGADVRLAGVRATTSGTDAVLEVGAGVDRAHAAGRLEIRSPLLGLPNAINMATAAAACLALGLPREAIVRGLQSVAGVTGRFERLDEGQPFTVLVDYAHTDDALRSLLRAVRDLGPRRVLTVFGCGGDRDRAKRPKMGRAAAEASDVVLVTSDNPRGEDPRAIIEEILPGVRQALTGDSGGEPDAGRYLVIPDRKEAIRRALGLARPGDCVVIAGKGHETYQILGTRTIPFDDREVAREVLRAGGRAAGGQGLS